MELEIEEAKRALQAAQIVRQHEEECEASPQIFHHFYIGRGGSGDSRSRSFEKTI